MVAIAFTRDLSLSSPQSSDVGAVIILIVQRRKLRVGEVKILTQLMADLGYEPYLSPLFHAAFCSLV